MNAAGAVFLCVGAAHWDVIGRSDKAVQIGDDVPGRIEWRPGGVALNVALGLTRQGCKVRLGALVGDDEGGTSLIRHAEAAGIDCADVIRVSNAATSHYLAIEDAGGSLVVAVADTSLLDANADGLSARLKHTVGSASAMLLEANLPASVMAELAEIAARAEVELVANPVSPAKAPRLRAILAGRYGPTIVANLDEANAILGALHRTSDAAAAALRRAGAATALISHGAQAAALATGHGSVSLTPEPLTGPASVTGAGDALLSAYLASPERHSSPKLALEKALRAARDQMTRHR